VSAVRIRALGAHRIKQPRKVRLGDVGMTIQQNLGHTQGLGETNSIWFKLTLLSKGNPDNPMQTLQMMADRYGPVITVNMADQRVVFLTEPEHFKHVLVSKADDYIKYFDGLKPVFGKSMITHDGALWQKIRMPQQPAFHPDMFAEYIPYFLQAIHTKMDLWSKLAATGEEFEMVEQTWTLAADMICKALFDRDMPFNPHVVFKCVKTYTDVMEHKAIRMRQWSFGPTCLPPSSPRTQTRNASARFLR
jgi:cytochrome P450